MIRGLVAIAALAVLFGASCGFNESPHRCTKKSDCPNDRLCVWSLSDGCGGKGHCEDNPECFVESTTAMFQGCGCDGKAVFDITVNRNGQLQRSDVCGWDGPIQSVNPCP
jgi:hypothetical protein